MTPDGKLMPEEQFTPIFGEQLILDNDQTVDGLINLLGQEETIITDGGIRVFEKYPEKVGVDRYKIFVLVRSEDETVAGGTNYRAIQFNEKNDREMDLLRLANVDGHPMRVESRDHVTTIDWVPKTYNQKADRYERGARLVKPITITTETPEGKKYRVIEIEYSPFDKSLSKIMDGDVESPDFKQALINRLTAN